MKAPPKQHALIKPLVFGGIDGLTTSLALVWGSVAAGEHIVSNSAVLILGVANLMATALSMGIGDYVGTLAEHEAKAGASAAVRNARLGDDDDVSKGLVHEDIRSSALRSGFTMFASFIVFGCAPLLPYAPLPMSDTSRRAWSTALCALAFFALGFVRSRMEGSHHQCGSTMRLSVNMMLMGLAAAFTSFCSSKGIYWLLGAPEVP